MKRINRIVLAVALISFVFNTTVSNLALCQQINPYPNTHNLATPDKLDNIGGIQPQRMMLAQSFLEGLLAEVAGNAASLTHLSHDQIAKVLKERSEAVPSGKSAKTKFFFEEMPDIVQVPVPPAILHRLCVKCALRDEHGEETFYLVFGLERDERQGFPVWIYPEASAEGTYESLQRLAMETPKMGQAEKKVPTLKLPGTPDLIIGTTEYEDLMARITAHLDRSLTHDELIRVRNIIQTRAPPAFFTEAEQKDMDNIIKALTGQLSLRDLGMKLKIPVYKGKPLDSIAVRLVDLKGERSFKTNKGNFYQEFVVYDEAARTLFVYITKKFFEENFSKASTTTVTQTVLHPLLESIMGLSHQEAALALSFYNSDGTIAKPGTITISDAHRSILEDVKQRAINGDKSAIERLNGLLNPDFRFSLTGADIQALKARGRTLESVDIIRIHSEDLSRIINSLVRGPIGKFETKVSLKDVTRPALIIGKMPTQEILDEYSLVTNATIAAALAVVADGYKGKVTELTGKAEVKVIKDNTDGLAKSEIQVIFNLSGYRITVTVSEGGLRDEVEESFTGGEVIGKKGMKAISIALDVVENTNAVAQGRAGGTSFAVSAEGEGMLLGMAPDVYASLIAAHVPAERTAEFEAEPLDPGPYDGEESIDVVMLNIKKQLTRIAAANGINLNQMEVVLLNRDRESVRLEAFKELEVNEGLKVTVIEDGTFNHAVKAALGNKDGKLKVFFGTSGAPEAFTNVIDAKPFHKEGALASMRILSNAGLKNAKNVSPSNAYGFNNAEQSSIRELRPADAEDILAGKKLFTTADVKGEIDGAITFITENEVFGLPGIKVVPGTAGNTYVITTLRIREKDGSAYNWVQQNVASITPLETKVGPYNANKSASTQSSEAQSVTELLNNIKESVRVTNDSTIITDRDKFVNETVDYLASEAALSQNPDVKVSAQRILREAALSFNLKLGSIHDFYMAKSAGKWANITVPAVNGRTDVYNQFQQLFRAAKEKNVGALILELARSEMRYAAQDAAEFNAVSIAAAIKQGYEGMIFAQGDHYQVNKEKYDKGGEDREKELKAIETLIRDAVLAGKYNIDLDPSTLVDEAALRKILGLETEAVNRYLESHPELVIGLDENGKKSVRRTLVDEIEMGKIAVLAPGGQIEDLYRQMHKMTAEVTMRFIRYIRALEKELRFPKDFHVSIGVEERHIDNPEHKNNPSTVLGSVTLMQMILDNTRREGLVGPSKLSLQTGTMHGVGGEVDFGIYQRHLEYRNKIGVAVFVQHGASTLEKQDFDKMREGDVGEVHLATEYQKIELDVVSRLLPELGVEMAKYLLGMMEKDAKMKAKFRPMFALAFGNPEPAIAAIKAEDVKRDEKIALYNQLAAKQLATQAEKGNAAILNQIVGDTMPKGLKGTLKDLVKELPGPFKKQLWNLPKEVRAATDQALYEEFSIILEKLGVTSTKAVVESVVPFNKQPVILPARPDALNNAASDEKGTVSYGKKEPVFNLMEILKLLPAELKNWLDIVVFSQAVMESGASQDIKADDKSVLIFSEKATFGEYKDGRYEEGMGLFLPNLARSGVRIAVVAATGKQKALIGELNEGKPENQQIIYVENVAEVTAKVHAARYYYFKTAGESDAGVNGVTNITIVVEKIIAAIGKVLEIDSKLIYNMHEAAIKFAQAA